MGWFGTSWHVTGDNMQEVQKRNSNAALLTSRFNVSADSTGGFYRHRFHRQMAFLNFHFVVSNSRVCPGCPSASVTCQKCSLFGERLSVTRPDRRQEELYLDMLDATQTEAEQYIHAELKTNFCSLSCGIKILQRPEEMYNENQA